MADRRLSTKDGPLRDDACKITVIETSDGVALLGYAGLGQTAGGMQPSEWMSNVLRGRHYTIPDSLSCIADAMQQEMPSQLRRMPKGLRRHSVVAPTLTGRDHQLWSIDMALVAGEQEPRFRHTRYILSSQLQKPPRFAFGGSGALKLPPLKTGWRRRILRVLKAYDKGQATGRAVAQELANLNADVHDRDLSVGPNCIVVWRNAKQGRHHKGGGGMEYFAGRQPDQTSRKGVPSIANGVDMFALGSALMDDVRARLDAVDWEGPIDPPTQASTDAIVAKLPTGPDERLR